MLKHAASPTASVPCSKSAPSCSYHGSWWLPRKAAGTHLSCLGHTTTPCSKQAGGRASKQGCGCGAQAGGRALLNDKPKGHYGHVHVHKEKKEHVPPPPHTPHPKGHYGPPPKPKHKKKKHVKPPHPPAPPKTWYPKEKHTKPPKKEHVKKDLTWIPKKEHKEPEHKGHYGARPPSKAPAPDDLLSAYTTAMCTIDLA